jgi:hypothetical protein
MRLTMYQDANLHHDLVTGRSMARILHFVKQTSIVWISKKQKLVETIQNGSELMVAQQACKKLWHYAI